LKNHDFSKHLQHPGIGWLSLDHGSHGFPSILQDQTRYARSSPKVFLRIFWGTEWLCQELHDYDFAMLLFLIITFGEAFHAASPPSGLLVRASPRVFLVED
jgi:hypothetical protein